MQIRREATASINHAFKIPLPPAHAIRERRKRNLRGMTNEWVSQLQSASPTDLYWAKTRGADAINQTLKGEQLLPARTWSTHSRSQWPSASGRETLRALRSPSPRTTWSSSLCRAPPFRHRRAPETSYSRDADRKRGAPSLAVGFSERRITAMRVMTPRGATPLHK